MIAFACLLIASHDVFIISYFLEAGTRGATSKDTGITRPHLLGLDSCNKISGSSLKCAVDSLLE